MGALALRELIAQGSGATAGISMMAKSTNALCKGLLLGHSRPKWSVRGDVRFPFDSNQSANMAGGRPCTSSEPPLCSRHSVSHHSPQLRQPISGITKGVACGDDGPAL